jgi:D-lactate dehydrogenase
MAPFVEFEWGSDAYAVMRQIKHLFDPHNLLNPDVIISDDPLIHLKHIKPMRAVNTLIDSCIECGFCEPVCPSHHLTFSPRQRIVARRAITKPDENTFFKHHFSETCAACGVCEIACPVGINTGKLVKEWRSEHAKAIPLAQFAADHFAGTTAIVKQAIRWGFKQPKQQRTPAIAQTSEAPSRVPPTQQVIYFSSCSNRLLPSGGELTLHEATQRVLARAGYQVNEIPAVNSLCCGLAFESKGFPAQGDQKQRELIATLTALNADRSWPVYIDNTACSVHLKSALTQLGWSVFDSIEFLHRFVIDHLTITPMAQRISIHTTCASHRNQHAPLLQALARRCAAEVIVPKDVFCCGFAGDKGFLLPELNQHALRHLREQVSTCSAGYSSNPSCEWGLSQQTGIPYQSIVFLLEQCSRV